MATLAIYLGDRFQRRVEFGMVGLRVGRAEDNDLVLLDPEKGVSRSHAEIRFEHGHYVVIDLNSQNGVWIGDRRVTREILVLDVPVTIGHYRLVLETMADRPATADLTYATIPAENESSAPEPMLPTAGASEPTSVPRTPPAGQSRKALLIGLSVAAVVGVVIVVAAMVASRGGRAQAENPGPHQIEEPPIGRQQLFSDHLRKAEEALSRQEQAAAEAEIKAALELQPGDERALAVREKIKALGNNVPPPPPDETLPPLSPESVKVPTATPKEKWPAGIPEINKLFPTEPSTNLISRARNIKDRYDMAQTELRDGSFQSAVEGFRYVLAESKKPDYDRGEAKRFLGVAEKELEAAKRRAEAKALLDAAGKLVASGDLAGARDKYDQAQEADPSSTRISEERAVLEKRIEARVADKLQEARTLKKLAPAEALEIYEGVSRLLRSSDPRLESIRKIMDDLRK